MELVAAAWQLCHTGLAVSSQVTAQEHKEHSSLHRMHTWGRIRKQPQIQWLESPIQLSPSLHRGEQETVAANISGQQPPHSVFAKHLGQHHSDNDSWH